MKIQERTIKLEKILDRIKDLSLQDLKRIEEKHIDEAMLIAIIIKQVEGHYKGLPKVKKAERFLSGHYCCHLSW